MSGTFPAVLPQLQDSLPQWLATQAPGSELNKVLGAAADQLDAVHALFDQVSAGRSLLTCSPADLYDQYAFIYSLQNEQVPPTPDGLRALLLALAAANGSVSSLLSVLIALLSTPANLIGGTVLTFDAGGAGLTFPATDGLTMYQYAAGGAPPFSPTLGLIFPADGSGVFFPGGGSGLMFPAVGLLNVIESPGTFTYTVQVKGYLAFDRPTFARIVNRLRLSHLYPPTIQEIA